MEMMEMSFTRKKSDEILIQHKTPGQEDQKIIEGYYHPCTFEPTLFESIKKNIFSKPETVEIPEEPYRCTKK
jgi:hypothetical protein